jgi:hypothetical protein
MSEREPTTDRYWTEDLLLAELRLPEAPALVRLQLHQAEEPIPDRPSLVPLAHPMGSRVYVHAQPYVLEPALTLTVEIQPAPPIPGIIGRVVDRTWEGMRHIAIGQAQAWFYPGDRLLMLWECYLFDPYRQDDPVRDPALAVLWRGFEDKLVTRFPAAERIATPAWEDLYPRPAWQAFLARQGYALGTRGVVVKERDSSRPANGRR